MNIGTKTTRSMMGREGKTINEKIDIVGDRFNYLGSFHIRNLCSITALGVATVTIRGNLNKVTPGVSLVPITNQQVKVVCGGITKTATTNASGLYVTTFTEAGCVPSSPVSTKSAYNGSIITRQVWVSSENRATIDLLF